MAIGMGLVHIACLLVIGCVELFRYFVTLCVVGSGRLLQGVIVLSSPFKLDLVCTRREKWLVPMVQLDLGLRRVYADSVGI